jgi:predicted transcriptional regulator
MRWSKENLMRCVKGSRTYKDILNKMGLNSSSSSNIYKLKVKLSDYNIIFNREAPIKTKWEKENLEKIVKHSTCFTEMLVCLGLGVKGNNIKTLKKYINEYNLNISHFNNKWINRKTKPINEWLQKNTNISSTNLKKRLYKEGLKERKCELCGQDEEWRGNKMSLILDHINGINDDNRIENLRIVCPNCNATLPTHCRGSLKKIEERKKERKKETKKNICKKCGKEISKNAKLCVECNNKIKNLKQRKVERPTYEQLLKEIEETSYCAVGRKYGVSDNAIRKWIKYYKKVN